MLEAQLKEYEKKNERVSRACDVTMIPYVKRAGGREYFNIKIKGKVERYYGIQRVMKCVGSDQDAAMEVRRVAHLMSIEYQIEAYFELGEMVDQKSKGSDVELSVKSQIPEAVSIDVPGRIEADSVVNLSKGFALNYIPRQVGDSVLEIRPKVQIANQELNRRCTKTNDYCRAERTKRDFIKVKFSAFDPRYDLPGLIGIGAGIVGIAAGVFGSGLFNMFRRRLAKSKSKS